MIFLILAIATSVANAFLLKTGELYQQERLVVMGFNYLSAALLSAGVWAVQGTGPPGGVTLGLGVTGGFFYATSLFLWMGAIAKVGLATSTAAARISVIWPTLLSLVAFAEVPSPFQLAGIVLTFVVLGMLGASSLMADRAASGQSGLVWLVPMFVLMGGVGITQKLFTEWGRPAEKAALLCVIFTTAMLLCWAGLLRGRHPLRIGDVSRGFVFGLVNACSSGLMLLGLERVAGAIAFPLVNIGILLLTALSGVVIWRERPGRLGISAMVLAVIAIVFMAA